MGTIYTSKNGQWLSNYKIPEESSLSKKIDFLEKIEHIAYKNKLTRVISDAIMIMVLAVTFVTLYTKISIRDRMLNRQASKNSKVPEFTSNDLNIDI